LKTIPAAPGTALATGCGTFSSGGAGLCLGSSGLGSGRVRVFTAASVASVWEGFPIPAETWDLRTSRALGFSRKSVTSDLRQENQSTAVKASQMNFFMASFL